MDEALVRRLQRYRPIIEDFDAFMSSMATKLRPSIRANTLLVSPQALRPMLEARGFRLREVGWHPWFFVVEDSGPAGQPGRTLEHLLGYYYIQELSSALPPLALGVGPGDLVLDMAAAPGSKTTQMAQMMNNEGTIVANDVDYRRLGALKSNVDRLRVTNVVITRSDARRFTSRVQFPYVLLDAPCSAEGTVRKEPESSPIGSVTLERTLSLSRLQRAMVRRAYELLSPGGVLVYSVCTFAPEEAELVVDYAMKLGLEPEEVKLPVRAEPGIRRWVDERGRAYEFEPGVEKAARVYPHLNDTGGMFIARLRKAGGR